LINTGIVNNVARYDVDIVTHTDRETLYFLSRSLCCTEGGPRALCFTLSVAASVHPMPRILLSFRKNTERIKFMRLADDVDVVVFVPFAKGIHCTSCQMHAPVLSSLVVLF